MRSSVATPVPAADAQVLWGERDPALKLDPYAEHVRQALAVETVTRLGGKHFVQEDAPQQIANYVSRLAAGADGRPARSAR